MSHDPVDALARGIRRELDAFVREAGRRRALPFTAYVGVPGCTRAAMAVTDDPVLRADLVARAVDGIDPADTDRGRACGWVTRSGPLGVDTREHDWHLAMVAGFGQHGLDLPAFFVVGRRSWLEVHSGRERTWVRVRPRGPGPASG